MSKTKDKIIQASIDFISKYGYAEFSIGNIAKVLTISKGVVNYHFPKKNLLLEAIVTGFYKKAATYMGENMDMDGDAKSALDSYIESNLRFVSENKAECLTITEIIFNARNEDGKLVFLEEDQTVFQPLIEIFTYGQEVDGSFRSFLPEMMARTVRGVIDHFCSAIAKGDINDVNIAIEEIKTLFNKATEKSNV
jgi:AcrR family transcriptional regulator